MYCGCVFFFKQKTVYEMRISDWSSDVCSSDRAMKMPFRPRSPRMCENQRVNRFSGGLMFAPTASVLFVIGVSPEPPSAGVLHGHELERSEERRVGKESVSRCSSRWWPYH